LAWSVLSAKEKAENGAVTAMSPVILLAITRVIILPTISIVVVWYDVVMIVMHHIRVAIFVVVVVMVIVVNYVSAVTAIDRRDVIFVVAAVVGPCAGSAEH
jgi:hypothetical protein